MPKPAYQKNRYLRLDGSPIEQGFIRRTFAPRGLSLCFLVAVGCSADLAELEDLGQLIPAVVYTGAGILQRRFINLGINASWQMDFHRYTIDTRPSTRTQHNPPDFYAPRAIFTTTVTGIAGVGALLNPSSDYVGSYAEHLSDTWRQDISTLFPVFHLAYQQGLAYHKVKTGQWKIIKMVDMEPAEDTKTSCEAVVLAHSAMPT